MKNNFQFFPAFVGASLLCLAFSELLTSSLSINGELVYTCGFAIVLYAIWCETYQTFNSIKPFFGYSNLASFWFKYKQLERSILSLVSLKVSIISIVLNIFVFTAVILKSLTLIKTNLFSYKFSLQVLNRLKLKTKSLPLQ